MAAKCLVERMYVRSVYGRVRQPEATICTDPDRMERLWPPLAGAHRWRFLLDTPALAQAFALAWQRQTDGS
jgi:hypothetical protein